jgi:hypothetical protein
VVCRSTVYWASRMDLLMWLVAPSTLIIGPRAFSICGTWDMGAAAQSSTSTFRPPHAPLQRLVLLAGPLLRPLNSLHALHHPSLSLQLRQLRRNPPRHTGTKPFSIRRLFVNYYLLPATVLPATCYLLASRYEGTPHSSLLSGAESLAQGLNHPPAVPVPC